MKKALLALSVTLAASAFPTIASAQLAFNVGAGSEVQRPLATVVIGLVLMPETKGRDLAAEEDE